MRTVENQNMEFKQAWNDNCLKTMCAFANTGIAVADLKKWHLSRPRNELLADVFFKAGMIEAWGRGTVKIVDECRKAGLPEPEFREEFGGLSVHFRKAESGQSVEKKVGDRVGDRVGDKLSLNQQKMLEHIKKKP